MLAEPWRLMDGFYPLIHKNRNLLESIFSKRLDEGKLTQCQIPFQKSLNFVYFLRLYSGLAVSVISLTPPELDKA